MRYRWKRNSGTASRATRGVVPVSAKSARASDANASPFGACMRYSGFFPTRSRARKSFPSSFDQIANANIPCRRSTSSSPHSSKPWTSTSVSDAVLKVWPARVSSSRSAR